MSRIVVDSQPAEAERKFREAAARIHQVVERINARPGQREATQLHVEPGRVTTCKDLAEIFTCTRDVASFLLRPLDLNNRFLPIFWSCCSPASTSAASVLRVPARQDLL
ncbi:hypothetical protein CH300_06100 [Rhodococcus sp. 15-1154-1]|nr:hypothetical protein CH300_06100 [Rhodococcus sp. 15-1154-1]